MYQTIRVTNQFDQFETLFLMRRYGIKKETVPEILSLIECAQDFTANLHTGPDGRPDWDALKAAKERQKERSKERRMLVEAEVQQVILEELQSFVQDLRNLGVQVEINT